MGEFLKVSRFIFLIRLHHSREDESDGAGGATGEELISGQWGNISRRRSVKCVHQPPIGWLIIKVLDPGGI